METQYAVHRFDYRPTRVCDKGDAIFTPVGRVLRRPREATVMISSTGMDLHLTFVTILIAFTGVFLISFMKGAFGGGFSIVGIPLLSLVMDPVTAGGMLAPLFIAMDLFALRYWKPSTWSKPDLTLLLPGLVTGIGAGYLTFRLLDHRAIAIVMAAITLIFVGLWWVGGAALTVRPRSTPKAITAGLASGVTTMVAHSGGPPLAMYLLPLGLSKEVYAGTTSMFFTVGNATKAVPWLLLARPTGNVWVVMAVCLFAIPAGVVAGWRLHAKLDQRQVYRACYGLLVVAAVKLLWDGVTGYLA
ncbi:sulfite exporter TauE/SafE family protein [Burkholderia cenocepacia]|uniref:sulfite exporter TauE/SafE family protein n=1 Tax=Burkholderia cenocepacia TaxID=95486 RepID=UPI002AB09CF9|nr:sulfite exporter TauE/SafE family protein [Burkholderia cenocepacia]